MSITAEKIALDVAKLPKRVTDDDAHAIISGPEKWSFIKGYAYALLQQGEPEGWREAKRIADLWFEPWGAAKAIEWEFSGDVPFTPENALRKIQRLLSASPLPPAPGADTGERKDHLADLVSRFSVALLEKLRAAEKKYGYDNGWLNDDWAYDLRRDLRKHIDKGDPRDVAAYCAFAWHHGWSTSSGTSFRQAVLEEAAKIVRKHVDAILDKHAYRETDTNATIFTNDGAEELAASLEEIEDEIRALATPPAEGETK